MNPNPVAPPAQKSWFAQNWKMLAGVGCGLMLLCCMTSAVLVLIAGGADAFGDASARVDCGKPGPGGVDCDVKRTAGLTGLKACWSLEITCQNGGVMTGQSCASLAAGTDATQVNMPVDAFSNQDACDVPSNGAVKNLTVSAE